MGGGVIPPPIPMSIYRAVKNIYWPCGELRAGLGDHFEGYEDHDNEGVAALGQKWLKGYESFTKKNDNPHLDTNIVPVPTQYIRQLRAADWDGKSPGDKMMDPSTMRGWMYTKAVPTNDRRVRRCRAKYLRLTGGA